MPTINRAFSQEVDFYSFAELLATSGIPKGRPVDYQAFRSWFNRHRTSTPIKDGHMLFEEFNGVLSGCPIHAPFLNRDEYLELGIRRSIFTEQEREHVYDLFTKYLSFLADSDLYNPNMLAFARLEHCPQRYDYIVVDEVQDITNVQLHFILRHLQTPHNFLLSGDSNQIVHPNFFSWANLKSMFYEQQTAQRSQRQIARILFSNYRNSRAVTALANKLLLIKNARFGAVDRESNYLVRCVSEHNGEVELLKASAKQCQEFNAKTSRSTRHAVLVLRDEDKPEAAKLFQTPLIFSIQEAKGLEYDNIILYNLVSGSAKAFSEISAGVTAEDLRRDQLDYARGKDKSDKSLEAFKFYINALYVAVTRAVKNIYILEQQSTHNIYQLLELADVGKEKTVAASVSSEQEWQTEAGKLEQQGKTEQAEAIRQRVLNEKPVPWPVLTEDKLPELVTDALNPELFNKKAKKLLMDYAIVYRRYDYMPPLAKLNFKPALTPEKYESDVQRRYTEIYRQRRHTELEKQLKTYGPNFRDPLNRTPLMIAAELGMFDLIRKLLASGASASTTDNAGRTAFFTGLECIIKGGHGTGNQINELFQCLPPQPLTMSVDGRLIKIDPHQGLFYTIYAFLMQGDQVFFNYCHARYFAGLSSSDVGQFLGNFPLRIIPEYRRRSSYISQLLSNNEYARPASRKLFLRISRGRYVLNPQLQLQLGQRWLPANEIAAIARYAHTLNFDIDKIFAAAIIECLQTIETDGFSPAPAHSTGGMLRTPLFTKVWESKKKAREAALRRSR